jgi:VIT1/CCC1 family predicted Fe2+/Mn2+ transporter
MKYILTGFPQFGNQNKTPLSRGFVEDYILFFVAFFFGAAFFLVAFFFAAMLFVVSHYSNIILFKF